MSVNKEIVKTCLIEDRVKKNWSSIVLAGCVFHYFVSTRFDSFRVAKNFSTAERFKYLFFSRNVKHELRVKIHELPVQIDELGVKIHELRVQIHQLQVQIHELGD